MNNTCLNCEYCGLKRSALIRCDHPSWDDEETEMRYVDPTFAEACEDYSPADGSRDDTSEDDDIDVPMSVWKQARAEAEADYRNESNSELNEPESTQLEKSCQPRT